jgi:hypothetical protein
MRYKRMLESAAAAVGRKKLPVAGWGADPLKGLKLARGISEVQRYWNPLTNRVDCEELANELGIRVYALDNGDVCARLDGIAVVKDVLDKSGSAAREAVTEVAAKTWRNKRLLEKE